MVAAKRRPPVEANRFVQWFSLRFNNRLLSDEPSGLIPSSNYQLSGPLQFKVEFVFGNEN